MRNISVGSLVKVIHSGYDRCKVVECRGPLGPNNTVIYLIETLTQPSLRFEIREDQIEVLQ